MGSSLFAGISGLASSGKQLDVIANNIANVNTVGFKAGKIHFGDILSQSVTGGSAAGMQVGRGVEVSGITTQFSSGSFETTANATDVAIDGDGFFIVEDADGGRYYTRAGSFSLDSNKDLVDINGYKVQGYNANSPSIIADISLGGAQSDPDATTYVRIGSNLDDTTITGGTFNASQTVYDSKGKIHALKVTFQKTEANGVWGTESSLSYVEDGVQGYKDALQDYSGVKFDADGVLEKVYKGTVGTVTIPDNKSNGTVTSETIDDDTGIQTGTITLTRTAGVWAASGSTGGYPPFGSIGVTHTGDTSIKIDWDAVISDNASLTLSGTWYDGDTIVVTTDTAPDPDTIATTETHTTMDGVVATPVVDRPGQVPHTGTLLLTRGATAAAADWTITDTGGYLQPTVIDTDDDDSTVEICLSGTSSTVADVTLTLTGTWAEGNTLTVPLSGCEAGTGLVTDAENDTATAVLNNPGKFILGIGNNLILTRTDGAWGVTNDGGYAGATVFPSSNDTTITIALDGGTETDITLTLSGTYANGNTLDFNLEPGNGTTPVDIELDFGAIPGTDAYIGLSSNPGVVSWDLYGDTAEDITGYASTSVIRTLVHDGYSTGSLKSISVTSDGTISGFFTNGQTSDIAQIILASFPNINGLKRMGKNLFSTTVESGSAVENPAGTAGMGDISPNSLEMSNTDIATEFINMITAQRAYQASAKIVTVTDQMMAELMNIKR